MNNQSNEYSMSSTQAQSIGLTHFLMQVYFWMTVALGITFITANMISLQTAATILNAVPHFLMIIIYLGLSILVPFTARRSPTLSLFAFAIFAFVTGVILAFPMQLAKPGTALVAFVSTGLVSGLMSAIGLLTKKDLSNWYWPLFAGLIALILSDILLWFIANSFVYLIVNSIGVIIFSLYLVYDTNKIKKSYYTSNMDSDTEDLGLVIISAMALFMDVINLFVYILRLLNSNRN